MTSRLLWEDILETDQEEASYWDDNDGEHMGKQIITFFPMRNDLSLILDIWSGGHFLNQIHRYHYTS